MRLDNLINEVSKELTKVKDSQRRLILIHQLNALSKMVAIRVNTKAEADSMLDAYKVDLGIFNYPFGPYLSWVEIPVAGGAITYVVMPPDERWPHWQIYLNPEVVMSRAQLLWSPDGRIGPHRDREGGHEIGPTVYVYQDGERCVGCEKFGQVDKPNVKQLVCVDKAVPPGLATFMSGLACALPMTNLDLDCPHGDDFCDIALLPISIILYIALAPTRELDTSWQPKRVLGKGSSQRVKVGHYQLTPIKKTHIKRRIARYRLGISRHIEIPSFVRGHNRRDHQRFLPWRHEYIDVSGSWVHPHWRGPEWEELPPHYTLAWGTDSRIDAARRLTEEGK